jgi:hypothetical protein
MRSIPPQKILILRLGRGIEIAGKARMPSCPAGSNPRPGLILRATSAATITENRAFTADFIENPPANAPARPENRAGYAGNRCLLPGTLKVNPREQHFSQPHHRTVYSWGG